MIPGRWDLTVDPRPDGRPGVPLVYLCLVAVKGTSCGNLHTGFSLMNRYICPQEWPNRGWVEPSSVLLQSAKEEYKAP